MFCFSFQYFVRQTHLVPCSYRNLRTMWTSATPREPKLSARPGGFHCPTSLGPSLTGNPSELCQASDRWVARIWFLSHNILWVTSGSKTDFIRTCWSIVCCKKISFYIGLIVSPCQGRENTNKKMNINEASLGSAKTYLLAICNNYAAAAVFLSKANVLIWKPRDLLVLCCWPGEIEN